MTNVTDISTKRPHLSGEVKCLNCSHEWVAVAPVGTVSFECPECHTHKGVSVGLTIPEIYYVCQCGNSLFFINEYNQTVCCYCGLTHD